MEADNGPMEVLSERVPRASVILGVRTPYSSVLPSVNPSADEFSAMSFCIHSTEDFRSQMNLVNMMMLESKSVSHRCNYRMP